MAETRFVLSVWHLWITDKSGKRFWNTTCGVGFNAIGEIHNMERRIAEIHSKPEQFTFIDAETAVIMLNGEEYKKGDVSKEIETMSDEDLLNALGLF